RRLIRPRANGFVVNEEARKGYPARLKSGDPLPEVRPAIPTPEAMIEASRGVYSNLSPLGNDCLSATPLVEATSEAAGDRGGQDGSHQSVAGTVGATGHATATPTAAVEALDAPALSVNCGSVALESEGVDTADAGEHPAKTRPLPPAESAANATLAPPT